MKRIFLISQFLVVTALTAWAQSWNTNSYGIFLNPNSTNVGVGTSEPQYKLDVAGTIQTNDILTSKIGLKFHDNFSYDGKVQGHYSLKWEFDSWQPGAYSLWQSSWGGMKFFTGGMPRLAIQNNGNVGIGTTNPIGQLHIGQQEAPAGSANSITRLTLQPYGHTGGPWNFICRDNVNSAYLDLYYGPLQMYTIHYSGNIGIGTTTPDYKLDVNGTIRAKEIRVNLNDGADFVFEDGYKLMNLSELDEFVKINKHLPEIAPAAEMTSGDGVDMGEMQIKLLQKIEELTLYIIEQDKKMQALEEEMNMLKNK